MKKRLISESLRFADSSARDANRTFYLLSNDKSTQGRVIVGRFLRARRTRDTSEDLLATYFISSILKIFTLSKKNWL